MCPTERVPGTEMSRHEHGRTRKALLGRTEILCERRYHAEAQPGPTTPRRNLDHARKLTFRLFDLHLRCGISRLNRESVYRIRILRERNSGETGSLLWLVEILVKQRAGSRQHSMALDDLGILISESPRAIDLAQMMEARNGQMQRTCGFVPCCDEPVSARAAILKTLEDVVTRRHVLQHWNRRDALLLEPPEDFERVFMAPEPYQGVASRVEGFRFGGMTRQPGIDNLKCACVFPALHGERNALTMQREIVRIGL